MCFRQEVDATRHKEASAQQRKRIGEVMKEFESVNVGLKEVSVDLQGNGTGIAD